MAHSREQFSRRSWLLAGLTVSAFRARAAPVLSVSFDGDNLHVAAPQLHFLTGRPLSRLKDGTSVVFLSQLTIFRDDRGTVFRRSPERLTVSYDVWEEKFKVVLAVDRRSVSRLSLAAARDLVPGESRHQRPGAGAQPALLAAVRFARRHPQRTFGAGR
jgi:hypothetical protein